MGAGATADWISVRYSRVTGWVCIVLMVVGVAPIGGMVALGIWMFVSLLPRPGQPLGQTIGTAALASISIVAGLATLAMFLTLSRRMSAALRAEVGLWTDPQGIHGHFGYRLAPICLPWEDVGRIEVVIANKNIALLAIEHRDPHAWEQGLPRWVRWRRRFVFRKTGMVPVLTWSESFELPLDALRDELIREWLRETGQATAVAQEHPASPMPRG